MLLSFFDKPSSASKELEFAEANAAGIDSLTLLGLTVVFLFEAPSREEMLQSFVDEPSTAAMHVALAEANAAGIESFFVGELIVADGDSLIGSFSTEDTLSSLCDEPSSASIIPLRALANAAGINSFLDGIAIAKAGAGVLMSIVDVCARADAKAAGIGNFLTGITGKSMVSLTCPTSTFDSLPSFVDESVFVPDAFGLAAAKTAGIASLVLLFIWIDGVSLIGPCPLEVEPSSLSESDADTNANGIANLCFGRMGDLVGLVGASFTTTLAPVYSLVLSIFGSLGFDVPEENAVGIGNSFFVVACMEAHSALSSTLFPFAEDAQLPFSVTTAGLSLIALTTSCSMIFAFSPFS